MVYGPTTHSWAVPCSVVAFNALTAKSTSWAVDSNIEYSYLDMPEHFLVFPKAHAVNWLAQGYTLKFTELVPVVGLRLRPVS